MFPVSFEYVRSTSVEEALAALQQHGGDARVLAGGQSLIPAMRYRLARPAVLVDINRVQGLDTLHEADGHLHIGATLRDARLEFTPWIAERYSLLSDVSRVVADPIVRHMGTVVGSVCHNDPSGDWTAAALAARATMTVQGQDGPRDVLIDDFLIDAFQTSVQDGELAIAMRLPTPGPRTQGSYQKIERKVGDYATCAAAVQLTLDDAGLISAAGVAITAAATTAIRVAKAEAMLIGQRPTLQLLQDAAMEASILSTPVADARGSVAYKKDMARVLVLRGLKQSLTRLNAEVTA
ncbi:carbon monoxide dehydrogenase medium subunit [Deinococcus aquiradiocola]|uniref:Carbon monoxide dehydrogenase medium subunit n=1 Tax=Deinococcus aquiradiocola TaxID=393059 RepID=A0A917PB92_9DEIO|nr:carbon monoxide dehydrogenase medium subunit [Deinococcus aquiradiocola]